MWLTAALRTAIRRAKLTAVCCSCLIGMRFDEGWILIRRMREGANTIAGEHNNQKQIWCAQTKCQSWALIAMSPVIWYVLPHNMVRCDAMRCDAERWRCSFCCRRRAICPPACSLGLCSHESSSARGEKCGKPQKNWYFTGHSGIPRGG